VGTRGQPLGEPKAGLSAELDALAAYVTSLEHVNPSPYRNSDGSLTPEAVAGKARFEKLGCNFCHGGNDFTDSARGMLHDVGTITAKSGMRAGEPLFGFDTPTLLGVWETPPYLHDGSAPTLRDVLTTNNPNDLHGFVSALTSDELDELVAYVEQIDNELPMRRLPFDPPVPEGGTGGTGGLGGGSGGVSGDGSGGMTGGLGGIAGTATGGATAADAGAGNGSSEGCACKLARGVSSRGNRDRSFGTLTLPLSFLGLIWAAAARRRTRAKSAKGAS
jgi:hypothetical protein